MSNESLLRSLDQTVYSLTQAIERLILSSQELIQNNLTLREEIDRLINEMRQANGKKH